MRQTTMALASVNLSLSGGGAVSSSGIAAGPSISKYGSDYSAADMADATSNSGSNNCNSVESLSPAEDKQETG